MSMYECVCDECYSTPEPICAECGGPIYQAGYRTCARCSSAACVGQRPAVWPRYETDQPLALFAAPDPLGTLDMFGEQS